MTDEQGPDRLDAAGPQRIRQAVEESSRQDENERSRQRNTGVAIAVLALVVVGLLIAMVSGAMPHA
jgi:succinate dehydrogenase hydrophobic anchor subunit